MANYLYNGVPLPPLPEEEYQFAYIGQYQDRWYLVFSLQAVNVEVGGRHLFISNARRYEVSDGQWIRYHYGDVVPKIMWSNTDVYYSDSVEEVGGTLYLAASDPIPVNPAPTLDPTALLMGWQVGNRIRGGA